jgi:predicted transcriptional regulator
VKIKCAGKKGRARRGEVTRIAAALGVTKGHVSRCLRGERQSGRIEKAAAQFIKEGVAV